MTISYHASCADKNYTKGPYSRTGKSGPFFFALI